MRSFLNYSRDFRERTRASSYYQGFSMVGELIGFALTPIIYAQYGFGPMAVFFAAITAITLLIGILRSSEDKRAQDVAPLKLKEAFGEVLQDRPFWLFAIALTFLTFTTGLYTLATPFWVKYTLNASPQATSLIFATVFIVAILTVSLWSRLIRYRGVKSSWFWAIGALALSAIVLGLTQSLLVGVIGAAVAGVGLAGIKICREMIMANLVSNSLARTGYRREGVYYSLLRFFGKLSKILEALALILLAVLFGYVSGDDPGPNPDNAFRFLISVLPFIFMVIALLLSRRFPFEDQAIGGDKGQEIR
ncbi:MFS transporter [Chloroflexota bacterium]